MALNGNQKSILVAMVTERENITAFTFNGFLSAYV